MRGCAPCRMTSRPGGRRTSSRKGPWSSLPAEPRWHSDCSAASPSPQWACGWFCVGTRSRRSSDGCRSSSSGSWASRPSAWRLVTRKPVVRVDHDGVSSGQRRALWSEIEGSWVWSMNSTAVVVVRLTPAGAASVRAQAHPFLRPFYDLNERMAGPSTMSLPSGNGFDANAMAQWLNSILVGARGDASSGPSEADHHQPPGAGAPFVPDWPQAANRPDLPPDPDAGFEAEDAPPSVVAVLQWTSGLLVDGGRGTGSWDLVGLASWAAGEMSDAVSDIGELGTGRAELERAVAHELGHRVSLAPDSWAFSRQDETGWWTAPLFVVHQVP